MMDGNDLGDALRAGVDAAVALGAGDREAIFRAMGSAIVDYIKAHATVTATVSVTAVTVPGVTVGVGTSGTGSGTGTATGSIA